VYRIASNESITYINKQKRTATYTIEHTAAIYKTGSDNENPEQVQLRLQAAINTLPDKQKQVFIMRYYDEMPYEEMSKILETSVGALKASYHHAVKKIEEIITA
jgi:RNA polymerase sigma-70 factor (ECF subfamily)